MMEAVWAVGANFQNKQIYKPICVLLTGRSQNLDAQDVLDAWEETVCATKKISIKQNHY